MIRSRLSFVAIGALLMAAQTLQAQQVLFHGQVRPRWEGRDPAGSGLGSFTSMRTRAALAAALQSDVSVFIELQDVRFFGEETNPLFDDAADGLDLHEGYAQLGNFLREGSWLRVGRQETNFGGQRLIGSVDWTQQGQSFDGARFQTASDWGTVDLIAYRTGESAAPSSAGRNGEVVGAYATVGVGDAGDLDIYSIYNGVVAASETDQATVGLRWVGTSDALAYRVESSFQFGTRADQDVSAYMFGARVGTEIADGDGTLTLWYDYLSGDDTPADGTLGVFETLFATNHKFYGFADLFLNIPAHTAGLGLQDLAVKGGFQASDNLHLGVDLHTFRLAKQGTISSSHLAEELDFTGTYRHTSEVSFTGGLSFVAQDDALAEIGRLSENLIWGYVMMNVVF
jgi:hypothetical protein